MGEAETFMLESCAQMHTTCRVRQVELQVTGIRAIARAGPLPFEVTDAARSDVSKAGVLGPLHRIYQGQFLLFDMPGAPVLFVP